MRGSEYNLLMMLIIILMRRKLRYALPRLDLCQQMSLTLRPLPKIGPFQQIGILNKNRHLRNKVHLQESQPMWTHTTLEYQCIWDQPTFDAANKQAYLVLKQPRLTDILSGLCQPNITRVRNYPWSYGLSLYLRVVRRVSLVIRHRVSLEADLGVPQGFGHHSDVWSNQRYRASSKR